MSNWRYFLTLLFALIIFVGGCSTLPGHKETEASFIDRQVSLARHQQQNQELATALRHWQVVLLLNPNHIEAQQQQSQLTKTLKQEASAAFKAGMSAFRSGNHRKAKTQFLTTLAAIPTHREAKQKLQAIQRARMIKAQQQKAAKETQSIGISPAEQLDQQEDGQPGYPAAGQVSSRQSPGGIQALQAMLKKGQYQSLIKKSATVINDENRSIINHLLGQAHSGLTQDSISKNMLDKGSLHFANASKLLPNDKKIAALRKELATAYHQNGRRLLSNDIDKGIRYLQLSLGYDPSNRHVQNLLKQSQAMKKRLSEIGEKK
ncbi:MAG: hypothetical protein KUG71_04940 [Porticoccaceae bacterium]|nr:hypothetical protein [Porticoccaceae bacterium]